MRILLVLAADVAVARPCRSSMRLYFMLNLASSAPLKFFLVENVLESGRAAALLLCWLRVIKAADMMLCASIKTSSTKRSTR
jgi:hypothetical protein